MVALSYEADAGVSWGIWGGVCARDRERAIVDAKEADSEGDLDLPGVADQLLAWTTADVRGVCPTGGVTRKQQAGASRRQGKLNRSCGRITS